MPLFAPSPPLKKARVVETAVATLGMERQAILTDVRRCDVRGRDQVNAA